MIDPTKVTNFNRTNRELEYFFIFSIVVAGKNANWAARTVRKFLSRCPEDTLPLDYIYDMGETALHNTLVSNKVGQYTRITKALIQASSLALRTCTLEQLEGIHGIGPKTARFFLVHSRRNARHAILDTHVLKWLKRLDPNAPTKTPTYRKDYLHWETECLRWMEYEFPELSVADADLLIWLSESGRLDPTSDTKFMFN